jgi:hypothetical protein
MANVKEVYSKDTVIVKVSGSTDGDESDSSDMSEPPLDLCEPSFTHALLGHRKQKQI